MTTKNNINKLKTNKTSEKQIISNIIQSYLRRNVSNYMEGVGDDLAEELISCGIGIKEGK